MIAIWLGAVLVVCGVLYMALAAIFRGRMSDARVPSARTETLEPARPGLRFLGIKSNWLGLLLILVGAGLLISGGLG
jgi:dipeptide/tripeptide permease